MYSAVKLFEKILKQLRDTSIPTVVEKNKPASIEAILTVVSNAVEGLLVDTPEQEVDDLIMQFEAALDRIDDLPVPVKKSLYTLLRN